MSANLFISIAAILAAVGLSAFTLSRNPRGALNQTCAVLFACLALSHIGLFLRHHPAGPILWVIAETWLPILAILFGLQLAHDSAERRILRPQWLIPAAAGIGITCVTLLLGDDLRWIPRVGLALPDAGKGILVLLLLFHSAALLQFENIFRAATPKVRWRIKYLLLGIGAILVARLYTLTLAIMYGEVGWQVVIEFGMATLAGGVAAAYAMVRHRLLNVDVFISRYVVYNSVTLLAVGAYLLAVGGIIYGLQAMGGALPVGLVSSIGLVALIVLAILLLSGTVRWKIRHFIDRNFYKNRHDYRLQWQAVTQALAWEHSADGLLTALCRMIGNTLGTQAAVLVEEAATGRVVRHSQEAQVQPVPFKASDLVADPSPEWLSHTAGLTVHRHPEQPDTLYLPMRFGDECIGWIALPPRISGTSYTIEDLELVAAMAGQTATLLRNFQLAQDLAQSREAAALHQLSTFFIHDMKNAANTLSLLTQNIPRNKENPEFWSDAEATLSSTVGQMRTLMERLRLLRDNRQAPKPEPVELAALMERWRQTWQNTVSARLALEAAPPLWCLGDPVLLESIFTNLVLNAAEAGATDIRFSAHATDGKVKVAVTDNGCGMDETFMRTQLFKPFASTKSRGMGVGLYQTRRMVEQLGGGLEVASSPGGGSCFTVLLTTTDPDR